MVKSSRVVKAVNVNVTQESLKKSLTTETRDAYISICISNFQKKLCTIQNVAFENIPQKIAFALTVTFQTDKGGN